MIFKDLGCREMEVIREVLNKVINSLKTTLKNLRNILVSVYFSVFCSQKIQTEYELMILKQTKFAK